MTTPPQASQNTGRALGQEYLGGADTINLDVNNWSGPIVVGDKTRLLKVGIVFTLFALATAIYLMWNIGTFFLTVVLLASVVFGLLVFIYRLLFAAHVLRIDDQGLDDRTQGFAGGFTAWDEFESCKVVVADGRPMLGLLLKESSRERRDFFAKTLMDQHRSELGCDIVLPPEVFGLDEAAKYAAFLDRFIREPGARSELA